MRRAVLIFALLNAALASASAQEVLRFEDLPKRVAERNGNVLSARSSVLAAESLAGFLRRSYAPHVDLMLGGERFQTGDHPYRNEPYGTAEARMNLFSGGRDLYEDKLRGQNAVLARAAMQQVYFEALSEARKVYWEWAAQKQSVALVNEALALNDVDLSAARKRIEAGLATETDRLEFEMNRLQLEQDLTRLNLEGSALQRKLAALTGAQDPFALHVSSEIPHEHEDALLKAAFDASHRDLQSLSAQRNRARFQQSRARRWWLPSVEAYANYSLYTFSEREYLDQEDRDDTSAGVRLTVNVFDGFQSRSEWRASGQEAESYAALAAQTEIELKARFESAKERLIHIHELLHNAEASVAQGKTYLSRTLNEYTRGVKNSPDVLAAASRYVELKRRLVELRKDYQLAKTEILEILGQ